MILLAAVGIAAAYQIFATLAALYRHRYPAGDFRPPVSILKPVRGAGEGFYQAIRSNAAQDYPEFELVFGFSDPSDPARLLIERVALEFPHRSIRTVVTRTSTPNAKVGVLMELAAQARYPTLLVADSDIRVPARYLDRVVAPLEQSGIGLVTCAYRARASSWASRFEALGVATDFGPSTMVAPFVGVDEFGLGATLVFRSRDLERIGGFRALSDYLADDYQLGRRIHSLGLKCVLSDVIVETHLGAESWRDAWAHQVRWARTIRVSRGAGYIGLPVTMASVWALVAAATGHWLAGGALLAIRLAMSVVTGYGVLGSGDALKLIWLVPFRDIFGAGVWLAGLFGNTVEWGGRTYQLMRDGRIHEHETGSRSAAAP